MINAQALTMNNCYIGNNSVYPRWRIVSIIAYLNNLNTESIRGKYIYIFYQLSICSAW